MALDSSSSLIAGSVEDMAGFAADTKLRTQQEITTHRQALEVERAELIADGKPDRAAEVDDELRRLDAEPVAEVEAEGCRVDPRTERDKLARASGPRQRTDKQLEEYVASLERERAVYVREGKPDKAQEVSDEIATAAANHSAVQPRSQHG